MSILILFVIATVSGGLAFTVGSPSASRVIVALHGASGLALLLLVPAKIRIAGRGMRRPGRSRKVIGSASAVIVMVVLASGLWHAIGGFRPLVGLLPMQIHVGAALVASALLVAHVLAHHRRSGSWRPFLRATDVDRRVALRGAALVVGAAALWVVAPGRERRFTGSHEVGTGEPAAMPVTQWLFDPVPVIAPAAWRLRLPGRELDLPAVAALPRTTVRAVLDCTGGWYAEQEWTGVPLAALGLPASSSIAVRSVTGYRRLLPAAEAGGLLLATHVAGRPLSAGHGGPARLVAPGRRGFWWVKWVVAVEVSDEPWWWQPPLPLQ